ncbi:MAG: peptidoglycan DD-metalloendopeptidase family protein [Hydrogenophilus sp.]|nr:peptidoglycan DD-metalloendopeptidase family protein [Hydrogenophilus sp.]
MALHRRSLWVGSIALGSAISLLAVAAIDPLPAPTPQEVINALPPISLADPEWRLSLSSARVVRERLQRGETLTALLTRLGADNELLAFARTHPAVQPLHRRLLSQAPVVVKLDDEGRVQQLALPLTRGEQAVVARNEEGFSVSAPLSSFAPSFLEIREGTIHTSLFATADEIGLPHEIVSRMAEVFGTEIDFTRDLRSGDSFVVLYETSIDALGETKVGDILAAQFTNRGKTYRVVRYQDRDGETAFYTPDGKALGAGFLRYPLKFTRISSTFGLRTHPITGEHKHHLGLDFAAPTGTPVLAASDGRVSFIGTQNGYGQIVVLEHRHGYETRYGHLSAFAPGLKVGQRIQQGTIVGYVGATGLATGPHLHYEIRIAGKPFDPQTVQLPGPEPLPEKELARFRQYTDLPLTQLDIAARTPLLADRRKNEPFSAHGG